MKVYFEQFNPLSDSPAKAVINESIYGGFTPAYGGMGQKKKRNMRDMMGDMDPQMIMQMMSQMGGQMGGGGMPPQMPPKMGGQMPPKMGGQMGGGMPGMPPQMPEEPEPFDPSAPAPQMPEMPELGQQQQPMGGGQPQMQGGMDPRKMMQMMQMMGGGQQPQMGGMPGGMPGGQPPQMGGGMPPQQQQPQMRPVWDANSGKKMELPVGDPEQGVEGLRGIRDINADEESGYMKAAGEWRTKQPSGGADSNQYQMSYGVDPSQVRGLSPAELPSTYDFNTLQQRQQQHMQGMMQAGFKDQAQGPEYKHMEIPNQGAPAEIVDNMGGVSDMMKSLQIQQQFGGGNANERMLRLQHELEKQKQRLQARQQGQGSAVANAPGQMQGRPPMMRGGFGR